MTMPANPDQFPRRTAAGRRSGHDFQNPVRMRDIAFDSSSGKHFIIDDAAPAKSPSSTGLNWPTYTGDLVEGRRTGDQGPLEP